MFGLACVSPRQFRMEFGVDFITRIIVGHEVTSFMSNAYQTMRMYVNQLNLGSSLFGLEISKPTMTNPKQ